MPDPQPLPPLALDGVPVGTMGWIHDRVAYAFTLAPLGDGKFRAAILSFADAAVVKTWPCDTLEQAQAYAAHDYARAAWNVPDKAIVVREPKSKSGPSPKRTN